MRAAVALAALLSLVPLASPAATPVLAAKDLAGIYVARLDIEGALYVAELKIKADGTYLFRHAQSADKPMPKPGCSGKWTLKGSKFSGNLDCRPVGGNPGIKQELDLKGATVASLAKGMKITVKSSALGGEAMPFKITRLTKPYFP